MRGIERFMVNEETGKKHAQQSRRQESRDIPGYLGC